MATVAVPGTYLHVEITKDKIILLNLRVYFIGIMCQFIPDYKQHVRYENVRKVLCLIVLRAVYGFIYSALLWYKIFSTTLKVETF